MIEKKKNQTKHSYKPKSLESKPIHWCTSLSQVTNPAYLDLGQYNRDISQRLMDMVYGLFCVCLESSVH